MVKIRIKLNLKSILGFKTSEIEFEGSLEEYEQLVKDGALEMSI